VSAQIGRIISQQQRLEQTFDSARKSHDSLRATTAAPRDLEPQKSLPSNRTFDSWTLLIALFVGQLLFNRAAMYLPSVVVAVLNRTAAFFQRLPSSQVLSLYILSCMLYLRTPILEYANGIYDLRAVEITILADASQNNVISEEQVQLWTRLESRTKSDRELLADKVIVLGFAALVVTWVRSRKNSGN